MWVARGLPQLPSAREGAVAATLHAQELPPPMLPGQVGWALTEPPLIRPGSQDKGVVRLATPRSWCPELEGNLLVEVSVSAPGQQQSSCAQSAPWSVHPRFRIHRLAVLDGERECLPLACPRPAIRDRSPRIRPSSTKTQPQCRTPVRGIASNAPRPSCQRRWPATFWRRAITVAVLVALLQLAGQTLQR